jgi:hypothetical protein
MRERVCKELEAETTYGGAHQVPTATMLLLTRRLGWYALEQSLGCARGEEVRAE